MAFTLHSLHKQMQIRTSNLRVLKSSTLHTALHGSVMSHEAPYKRGHGHQLFNFVLTSVNKMEFFNSSTLYRGTITSLGKNNNSVSKSPDGKSLI
jgi:hypothetical protein